MIAKWPLEASRRRVAALVVVLALLAVAGTVALAKHSGPSPTGSAASGAGAGPGSSTAAPTGAGGSTASSSGAANGAQAVPGGSTSAAAEAAATAAGGNPARSAEPGTASSNGAHNGLATQAPSQTPQPTGSCLVTQVSAPGGDSACTGGWTMQPSPGP